MKPVHGGHTGQPVPQSAPGKKHRPVVQSHSNLQVVGQLMGLFSPVKIAVGIAFALYGVYYFMLRSNVVPYCLTSHSTFLRCRQCPDHAICLSEEQAICLPGFILDRSQNTCDADLQLGIRARTLALQLLKDFQASCSKTAQLRSIARQAIDNGNKQLQVKMAIDIILSEEVLSPRGIRITHNQQGQQVLQKRRINAQCSSGKGLMITWLVVSLIIAITLAIYLQW